MPWFQTNKLPLFRISNISPPAIFFDRLYALFNQTLEVRMSHFSPIEFGDAMNTREAEIQKRLATLHQQLDVFSYPTPGDNPADYEVEELEAWARSTEQIHALEKELSEIRRSAMLKAASTKNQHHLET
jgi:hypothetical protein